jgi:hypothetical protein
MPAVYQIGQTEGEHSRPQVPIVWRQIGDGLGHGSIKPIAT